MKIGVDKRFWDKVDKNGDGCWLWKATKIPDGYGMFYLRGHMILSHRFAWELTNGPIPKGLEVLHKCDNPPCVRPEHLFLGSKSDNIRDCVKKGRNNPSKGEKNGWSKLTNDQVIEIRNSKLSLNALAKIYSVGKTCIAYIKSGKSWKHLCI